ncbi:MAG: YHS domain-containing (seleno)protein [Alphaproteobacteria bacterium]
MVVLNWVVTQIIAVVAFVAVATGSVPEPSSSLVFAPGGVAIRGYDPVAYFTEGQPVQGNSRFTYEWNGATWRFTSAENLAQFTSDPRRFAPQYGGYCAWGVNFGYTASTDPNSWAIRDGRLYLNNSSWVHRIWKLTPGANISWADKRWPDLFG